MVFFNQSDARLDLWCHTVWQETGNAFSYLAPAVQLGRLGAALTLEALGRRWGWEKTKVWRFFQKNGDAFALHRLPGSYGCLIFNRLYPLDTEASLPTGAEIERIIEKMRICAGNAHIGGSDNARLNKMTLWYSRRIIIMRTTDYAEQVSKNRVALSSPIIRAYISLCWNRNQAKLQKTVGGRSYRQQPFLCAICKNTRCSILMLTYTTTYGTLTILSAFGKGGALPCALAECRN